MTDSMTSDIMDYLAAQGVNGTITRGYMPDAPTDIVTLYEYAGRPPSRTLDGNRTVKPGLQVVVRSSNYDTARAKLQQIEDVLDGKANLTLYGSSSSISQRCSP